MTDTRKLLERCARVMGYIPDEFAKPDDAWGWVSRADATRDQHGELPIFLWNPLTSVADAAAMAIKMKVDVMWTNVPAGNQAVTVFQGQQKPITAYFKDHPTEQAAYCYAVCSVVAQMGGE